MAIDTLAKRNSVISFSGYILPIPNGAIGQDDRQSLLKVFGGILAGALSLPLLASLASAIAATPIQSENI